MKTEFSVEDEIPIERKVNTLGSVRLHDRATKRVILVPTPSDDPNDPLNWSIGRRRYNAALVCLAVFTCNFLAAGPTVAIVETTVDYFGPPGPDFVGNIGKVAYFFTATSLLQGMSNLFWMPLVVKYGRRPVYVISFSIYTAAAIWASVATSYGSELAARIIMGIGSGTGECLGPLTISDIFFLHERGTMMALFTASLSSGVSGGIIISGLITIDHGWRYIYYVSIALIGAVTILIFLTMPETSYARVAVAAPEPLGLNNAKSDSVDFIETANLTIPPKRTYLRSLAICTGTYTTESLFKLFMRPIILLALPPVLWATLVMSVTIGLLVAVTSNFASAFDEAYQFQPWQSGLCFFAGIIGSFIAIFMGGHLSDSVAYWLTKRNNDIREPEMRLPAIIISLISGPLGLIIYGAGIDQQWHWIVPVIGLGLLSFTVVQATNITLVYAIDAYRPVAGEIIVAQFGFKSAFGFLLSFYTNPWIAGSGYLNAFGAMAGISGAVMLMWIPLYIWGKRIRHLSVLRKLTRWHLDRETGE